MSIINEDSEGGLCETGVDCLRYVRITVELRRGNIGQSIDTREATVGALEDGGVCFCKVKTSIISLSKAYEGQ